MLLHKNDFRPYFPADGDVICRRVRTKEDFRIWVDVVNTALHGWEMIDAEHYAVWLEKENLPLPGTKDSGSLWIPAAE